MRILTLILTFGLLTDFYGQTYPALDTMLKTELSQNLTTDGRWVYYPDKANIEKIEKPLVKAVLPNYEFYKVTLTNYLGYHVNQGTCLILFDSLKSKIVLGRLIKSFFTIYLLRDFYVESDNKLLVRIDYYLYVERKKDYDEYSLVFSEIENMKFQEFSFTKENDLEIASFDYELEQELLKCKILFLTGFAQASIDLEINCRNIEIVKNEPNTQ